MTDFKLPKYHESRTNRVTEQVKRIADLRDKAAKAETLAAIFSDYADLVFQARQSDDLRDIARDEIISLCNRRVSQMNEISKVKHEEADKLETDWISD